MLPRSAGQAAVTDPGRRGEALCGENKAWPGEHTAREEAAHSPADSSRESGQGQLPVQGVSQTQGASNEGQDREPSVFV